MPLINIALFPHQRSAVARMRSLETDGVHVSEAVSVHTSLGLYTEKPGSGKSYALLTHMLESPLVARDDETRARLLTRTVSQCGGRVCTTIRDGGFLPQSGVSPSSWRGDDRRRVLPVNVVLVPYSTFSQWEKYAQDMSTPKVRTVGKLTGQVWDTVVGGPSSSSSSGTQTQAPQVLIVHTGSYPSLQQRAHQDRVVFQRFVIDEADSISCKNFDLVPSLFLWCVTATPHTLGTSRCACYAIRKIFFAAGSGRWESDNMRFVRDYLQVRHDDGIVDAALSLPPPVKRLVRVVRSPLFDRIRTYLTPMAAQALDACDFSAAREALGCVSADGDDGIVAALVDKIEREISCLEMRRAQAFYHHGRGDDGRTGQVESGRGGSDGSSREEQAVALTHDLALDVELTDRIAARRAAIRNIMARVREADCCPIGLDAIENKAVTPCCQHAFEFLNIARALARNARCPLCRSALSPSQLVVSLPPPRRDDTSDDASMSFRRPPSSAAEGGDGASTPATPLKISKADALKNELRAALTARASSKILVFSCFSASAVKRVVHEVADELNLPANRVVDTTAHASVLQKRSFIDRFVHGDVRVMVVDAHSTGAGVNLECATHVFTMHGMRDDLYTQVVGRAQRPGRTTALNVVDFRYEDEE